MTAAASIQAQRPDRTIRVLIVEDNSVVRRLAQKWINDEPDLEVVGQAINGRQGIQLTKELRPDVVTLDVEMPVMDGITALPEILRAHGDARVVMASTLTRRNAEITLHALTLGAADYIPKPEASPSFGATDNYRRELIAKIRELATAHFNRAKRPPPAVWRPTPSAHAKISNARPEAVFIGASTGGPQALRTLFAELSGAISVPVFIAQHMPHTFTTILAEHLSKTWAGGCVEAADGMIAKPGAAYLAPGGYHMTVKREGGNLVTRLDQRPPENFCRPAVDPLFRSAAVACGASALCVVLTGMGVDGCAGAKKVVEASGSIIAQDEATSVVWGMPGAVANANLTSHIAPLDAIAPAIITLCNGKKL